MAEAKRYSGGCHCGKVRYSVETALVPVMSCNCSICAKRGYLLTFVTPDAITFESGEDDVTDYRFNSKKIEHLFCPTCGVASFGRGKTAAGQQMYAINVRCLDGIDLDALNITYHDGRSM